MQYWFFLQRWAAIRVGAGVTVLAGALMLPFLMDWAAHWYGERGRWQQQMLTLNEAVPALSSARKNLQVWQETGDRWDILTRQAQQEGLLRSQWDSRSFRVDGNTMSRSEADLLLRSLNNGANAFMLPEGFSLRVVNDRQSLFTDSPGQDRADSVHVSLGGTYYSRKGL